MNIYALNTVRSGLDTIDLVSKRIAVAGVIGLSHRDPGDSISDYVYQADWCQSRKLNFIEVETYGLSSEADKGTLLDLNIDVLMVTGWQRLIPQWFIDHCTICAIGAHGSPLGITKGRGRSPQNWALILGMKTFDISIFEMDADMDSGRIIDTRQFSYSPFDDIKTSYYKTCLLTADMLVEALQAPTFSHRKFSAQAHDQAEYFPQRTPHDGAIDWHRSNREIARFVRALTKPYPGAETEVEGQPVRIWSALPFDIDITDHCSPGEIMKIFNKGDVLVKAAEGYVLIDDYTAEGVALREGMQFASCSFKEQMKVIIDRHERKYPHLPLSPEIKKYKG